ncbi:MAG: tetratricopeptide repeat protein [Planctomycetaceae bacterium]|nr:tetratricopeptide repeat protein [Planctomycetaceae bacterium]
MTETRKYVRFYVFSTAFLAMLLTFAATTSWTQDELAGSEPATERTADDQPIEGQEPEKTPENENPGLEALNQAIEIKMSAETMRDLNNVIRLCEKAIEDGLSTENLDFCHQLLSATLIQRGVQIADLVLENRPLPPNWKEYRNLAITDFEKAFKYVPEEPINYLFIARLSLLPDGDRELAAKYAEKAIEYCSGNDEIHAQALVVKADLAEDTKTQIELLREAHKVLPDSVPVMILLGGVLAADNQLEEAITILQQVLDFDPENVQALEFAAAIRVQEEKFDEALKIYDRLAELMPRSFVPQIQKAEVLQEQKKYDDAMAVLDALRSREPGNPMVLLQRGKLFAEMEDYDAAMRDIDSTLRLTGDMPELETNAYAVKITILCKQEKFAEALTGLQKLPAAKRNSLSYKLMAVQVYAMAKSNEPALKLLDEMLAELPDNQGIKRFRGDMLLGLGRHKEAIGVYNELLEAGDEDDGVYNNLAWVLATSPDDSLRDGKLALEYAMKSSELTHYKKPHILSTLASAYAELGDFDNAVKWIEKGLELAEQTEYDQKEHLDKELASYLEKKPWRERLEENAPDPLAAPTENVSAPQAETNEEITEAVETDDIFESVE